MRTCLEKPWGRPEAEETVLQVLWEEMNPSGQADCTAVGSVRIIAVGPVVSEHLESG